MDVNIILIIGMIIIVCILINTYTNRIGFPSLLLFLILGMLVGIDGIFHINFEDYELTYNIGNYALIFIMFSCGFSTNIPKSKKIMVEASVLSVIGVILTVIISGFLCFYIFKSQLLFWFLICAIVGSTDATTVFSILKNSKLNLKYNTADLLTIESGSNDPIAYTSVMIILGMMSGYNQNPIVMFIKQLIFGIAISIVMSKITSFIINNIKQYDNTINISIIFGCLLITYALCDKLEGNGYLSVYLLGILLGNSHFKDKVYVVRFYDSITSLAQIILFFMLGLLITPHTLFSIMPQAFIIFLVLTFVARPIMCFLLMSFFKPKLNQIIFVCLAGLRGASAIIFSIMVSVSLINQNLIQNDDIIYNYIFLIVIFSILFQGFTLPFAAKKINMIDNSLDVLKSFNDYQDDTDISFIKIKIDENCDFLNKEIKDIKLADCRIAVIQRNKHYIIPKGNTVILKDDILVLSGIKFTDKDNFEFIEEYINVGSKFSNKLIKDISLNQNQSIIMIKRDDKIIMPNGNIQLKPGDLIIMSNNG